MMDSCLKNLYMTYSKIAKKSPVGEFYNWYAGLSKWINLSEFSFERFKH